MFIAFFQEQEEIGTPYREIVVVQSTHHLNITVVLLLGMSVLQMIYDIILFFTFFTCVFIYLFINLFIFY